MKKFLLSVVCLMVVGIQVALAQTSVAVLHHNDTVTVYAASQLQTAVNKAVTGDTIYLSAGMFGGMDIAGKSITVIGAGQTTAISGDVIIREISGQVSIGYVNMMKSLIFQQNVEGAKIERCTIDGDCNSSDASSLSGIELQQTFIRNTLKLSSTALNGLTAVGCKIGTVESGGRFMAAATFHHCNIGAVRQPSSNNSYDSCILPQPSAGTLKNCLYANTNVNGATMQDCYLAEFTLDDDLECSLDAEAMKEYLGTDGSVVGASGGDVPFTLVSPTLQVVEHQLEVNDYDKKLKVTLKLGNK